MWPAWTRLVIWASLGLVWAPTPATTDGLNSLAERRSDLSQSPDLTDFINQWEQLLLRMPTVPKLIRQMVLISNRVHVSLAEPWGGWKFVEDDSSLRTILMQVGKEAHGAFLEAQGNMHLIAFKMTAIEKHVGKALRAIGSRYIPFEDIVDIHLSTRIEAIRGVFETSVEKAKETSKAFQDVMGLTKELGRSLHLAVKRKQGRTAQETRKIQSHLRHLRQLLSRHTRFFQLFVKKAEIINQEISAQLSELEGQDRNDLDAFFRDQDSDIKVAAHLLQTLAYTFYQVSKNHVRGKLAGFSDLLVVRDWERKRVFEEIESDAEEAETSIEDLIREQRAKFSEILSTKRDHPSAAEQRSNNALSQAPNFITQWEQLLIRMPTIPKLLGQMVLFSVRTYDVSLAEHNPSSLRGSLIQVGNEGWKAFYEAQGNMERIGRTMTAIPKHVRTALRIIGQSSIPFEDVPDFLSIPLEAIQRAFKKSVEEAKEASKAFLDVTRLNRELGSSLRLTVTRGRTNQGTRKIQGHLRHLHQLWSRLTRFFQLFVKKAEIINREISAQLVEPSEGQDRDDLDAFLRDQVSDIETAAHLLETLAYTFYQVSKNHVTKKLSGLSELLGARGSAERKRLFEELESDAEKYKAAIEHLIRAKRAEFAAFNSREAEPPLRHQRRFGR